MDNFITVSIWVERENDSIIIRQEVLAGTMITNQSILRRYANTPEDWFLAQQEAASLYDYEQHVRGRVTERDGVTSCPYHGPQEGRKYTQGKTACGCLWYWGEHGWLYARREKSK
jgi:hypothetical protein